jgi:hypothetical protein
MCGDGKTVENALEMAGIDGFKDFLWAVYKA